METRTILCDYKGEARKFQTFKKSYNFVQQQHLTEWELSWYYQYSYKIYKTLAYTWYVSTLYMHYTMSFITLLTIQHIRDKFSN